MPTFEKPAGYDWYIVFRNLNDKTEIIDCTIFGVTTLKQVAEQAFYDTALYDDEFEIISIERSDIEEIRNRMKENEQK